MKKSAFLLLLLFASPALFAHDTWIVPEKFSVGSEQEVTFTVTSGMDFPQLESGAKPERVEKTGLQIGGAKRELINLRSSKEALKADAAIGQEGLVVAWIQLKPRDIKLSNEQVLEYFDEIRAPEDIRQKWAEQKGKTPWLESYTKCAKTLFFSGSPAPGSGRGDIVGLALEIVPVTDPVKFQAGEEAAFRLVRAGKPLPGIAVALHQKGKPRSEYQTTDEEGLVRFRLPGPGAAMLSTVYLRPPEGGTEIWKSEFSTVTFEVKEKE